MNVENVSSARRLSPGADKWQPLIFAPARSLYCTDSLDQFAKNLLHLIEREGTQRLRTHVAARADT